MVTINVSKETKERFKNLKLKESARLETSLTEEDFEIILLNEFEDKRK